MGARRPLFLARSSYRRRRVIDAARLLPFLGVVLFVLPVLWAPTEPHSRETARDGVYLFTIWFALIFFAALIARRLSSDAGAEDVTAASEASEDNS